MDDVKSIILLFPVILTFVGIVEFGVNAMIVTRAATGKDIDVSSQIITDWLKNAVIHLVIDTLAAAFVTAILGVFLGKGT